MKRNVAKETSSGLHSVQLVTTRELADLLACHPVTIRRLAKRYRIKPVLFGAGPKSVRWRLMDFVNLLRALEQGVPTEEL